MLVKRKKISPYTIILVSFIIIILIGGFLLSSPIAIENGQRTNLLEGMFTATSAVCVTGLTVNDVSKVYNLFGKTVIMVLIQLGGIGIITFSTVVVAMISKKVGYFAKKLIQEDINTNTTFEIQKFVKKVLTTVFIIEIIGAAILFLKFIKIFDYKTAAYYAIFHSISAFCNAGFALFSNNLSDFKNSIIINTVIPVLIFLGGIGFAAILNIYQYFLKKDKRLTTTTRIAIKMSIFLIIFGTIITFILEYSNNKTLGTLPFFEKIGAAFFQSVTTRTAGFNTISIAELREPTVFLFVVLMFIGASPGSTGGGIKTTTAGLILFGIITTIKNKEHLEYNKRRISWKIYNKAMVIVFISIMYVAVVLFLLIWLEDIRVIELGFELVSAFGTVGLSRDLTPQLSSISKLLIMITMFVGRVGPLTITLALSRMKNPKGRYVYPKEDILIG
ncbi:MULTISPECIES: TrkH family potassium uptake protein [unclassified Leptotrichia]|uniref:TrkH family potassium uptake protein n=1 Tax=unclassified Leptotrichia TaxID=2633022 RepID=UPI0003AE654F|nr:MULTISPECIES: TrkH family potassium uptake protein [unclassified Leptotrichia]ERL26726.1 hypothetical protein HMPREF9108_00721 [Leptotrichia sp. oral taxon 225 str. F0581]WLD74164.1 TrkH family potassium uptake protein [Leptotrichia sp. HMT-225]